MLDPQVAVGNRRVVRISEARRWVSRSGLCFAHLAKDLVGAVSAQQLHDGGPCGDSVGIHDPAGSVAEERGAVEPLERYAADEGLRGRVWIVLGDPVAAWLVASRPQSGDGRL